MFRALWFLLQLSIIIAGALWLVEQPGAVTIDAFGYSMEIQTGMFLIVLLVGAMLFTFIARLIGGILGLPGWLSRRARERRRAKSVRYLVQGFSALSAGDHKRALHLTDKVRKGWPEQKALPLWMEAQAADMGGDKGRALHAYEQLMADKDAVFLGIKGLLVSAMQSGNVDKALSHAQKALKLHPKQPWIIRTVYHLQLENADYDAARATQKKAVKLGAITKEKARSDEGALLMIEALRADESGQLDKAQRYLEKAVKTNPAFVPAVVRLSELLLIKGKNRKARALVEAAWKQNPHLDLVGIWDQLAPANSPRDMMKRLRWYEDLVALNPDAVEGQLAAAKAAMEDGLMGESRAYLMRAEGLQPTAQVYKMLAKLERLSGQDEQAVHKWQEKALEAAADKVWHCRKTGMIYQSWAPIARPHGAFNTIEWGYPAPRRARLSQTSSESPDPALSWADAQVA